MSSPRGTTARTRATTGCRPRSRGGWDVAGVALAQSGPFLTPSFTGGDPSGTGANVRGFTSTTRPDQVGDGNVADPTVDHFFDRNGFVIPANNIGRFGNAPVGSL